MILAEKIMKERKKLGWSQEELAGQLGVSRQSVSKWESAASIPDLDKILKMSSIFGVSTDYLLKDEMETVEPVPVQTAESEGEDKARWVSLEEANAYMELSERTSGKLAAAVALMILSPICLLLLGGLSELTDLAVTENMAGGIGVAVLLVMVAIGAAVLIINGIKLSKYEYLEKESIALQYGVEGIVKRKKEEFDPVFRTCIATGVVLCIIGVVPLMIAAAMSAADMVYVCCVAGLLFLIACGVFLFVRVGTVHGSYMKLLQEEEYTPEKKRINRKLSFFPGIYWCIIVAIYLGISFTKNNWEQSWIIWPVAGVLFAAVQGILSAVIRSREEKQYRE